MSRVSRALHLFNKGCSCSQSIVAAYGQSLGLSRTTALQIAAGFGGGMRLGQTCGAVTGAIMVLGLRYAPEKCDTAAERADLYARVVDFTKRFREQNGSVVCRELLGCDISTPEGMKQAQERKLFDTVCVKMVEDAARILEEMGVDGQPAAPGDG
jgi:C_GCAxxG_C_C family probable redox protein